MEPHPQQTITPRKILHNMSSVPSAKGSTRAVRIHQHGDPLAVIRVEDIPLPAVGRGQVLVRMTAAPINPADINTLEGKYAILNPLPAVPGIEGAGVITELGEGVTQLRVGQRVKPPAALGSWRAAFVADAVEVLPLPAISTDEQAAMLYVNPPTALRMIEDFVVLRAGDWLIQNAANSAVGRLVIQLARLRGIRTINLVRRAELIDELRALGATAVLTDEAGLPQAVRELTGDHAPRLGLNAVGGDSALQLAKALAPHATLVTYGAMSRQPFRVPASLLIFKDLRLRGFWITEWYKAASSEQTARMIEQLAGWLAAGDLKIPVARTYPLNEAKAAVTHAMQPGRDGKILFRM